MKRLFFTTLMLLSVATVFSQGAAKTEAVNPKDNGLYKLKQSVYVSALRYNDMQTATSALYEMILMDPQDVLLVDSLALMYFENRNYTSSILICKDILSRDPNNLRALEISAVSFENLGLADKALPHYESLYLKKSNMFTLYKLSSLQLQLERLKEAETNADIILANAKSKEMKLVFAGENQQQQEVPMTAAAYNLKGLIFNQRGDKKAAKEMFNAALKIQPDFVLVKNNLAGLDE